jgi:hypothetical protein
VNRGYPKCWDKAVMGSASSIKILGSSYWGAVLLVVLCVVAVW